MDINEFKESVFTRWGKHPTEGVGGRKAKRLTPVVHELVDEICRLVEEDFQERGSEERRSELLENFALWRGWDKLQILDWDLLRQEIKDGGMTKAVIWLSAQLDEARNPQPTVVDPALPSESDLEDAYHALDAIALTGSPKQIKWARSIAWNSRDALAMLWKQGVDVKLPTQAAWWIENRGNLLVALRDFS